MNLLQSVENIVVSALAEARAAMHRCPANEPDSGVVTRDIILAVADEMQKVEADKSGPFRNMNAVSDWLRSHANPDSAESDNWIDGGDGFEYLTSPWSSHPVERLMTERTYTELAERLEWWLLYFNDATEGERHPDFADDPEGFNETAIEADLREAAQRLRSMESCTCPRRASCPLHGYETPEMVDLDI